MKNILNTFDKCKIINADVLKITAVITMLVDHIGAGIFLRMIQAGIYPFGMDFEGAKNLYYTTRHIGRQAFPIYCFLLVQGLIHTKNIYKYLLNLGIFGIISEIPFDIALKVKDDVTSTNILQMLNQNAEIVYKSCNVYFTLLIGLAVIWVMKQVEERLLFETPDSPLGFTAKNPFYMIPYFLPAVAGAAFAYVVDTDYDFWGITLIAILFVFRKNQLIASLLGYIFLMNLASERWAIFAFILIIFYNGERGAISRKFKYAFYAFYPLHLIAIYLIRLKIMG